MVQTGWLLRDGEVLASTVKYRGWRSHLVTKKNFTEGIGAIVIAGPALSLGVPVARLGEASRLRAISTHSRPHLVGFPRQAIAVKPEIAARLRTGDELEFRVAS